MIVFDLQCAPLGHVFEAWFGSSGDFDEQKKLGLVQCPLCGAADVEKAAMAPRLATGCAANTAPVVQDPARQGPVAVKAMLATMAAVQRQMLAGSDYVGSRFADEARAIYLGEADARSIYGKATEAETRSLLEEGIDVAPLPFPVVLPGEEN